MEGVQIQGLRDGLVLLHGHRHTLDHLLKRLIIHSKEPTPGVQIVLQMTFTLNAKGVLQTLSDYSLLQRDCLDKDDLLTDVDRFFRETCLLM